MDWAEFLHAHTWYQESYKITLGMHIVKYGCDLLGPLGTLKSAVPQLKNKFLI